MHLSEIEFLKHIADECRYLLKEAKTNTFDDFVQDERLSRAICRSLEIIGEACNKISPDTRAIYPNIPWREMSDIRNKIIHHYFGVDYDIVWDTVVTDIPQLAKSIHDIIGA